MKSRLWLLYMGKARTRTLVADLQVATPHHFAEIKCTSSSGDGLLFLGWHDIGESRYLMPRLTQVKSFNEDY